MRISVKVIIGTLLMLFPTTHCLFPAAALQEADRYAISVHAEGLGGKELLLAYHLGSRQFVKDTITLDSEGRGVARGSDELPHGVYILVLPEGAYFELLISDNQEFEVFFNPEDLNGTLRFSGSDENSLFARFQKEWMERHSRGQQIRERLNRNRANQDSVYILTEMAAEHEDEVNQYFEQLISENRGTLFATLVAAMAPPPTFEADLPADTPGRDSLLWVMRYNHRISTWFDNFDLSDERLLRSPLFNNKISQYFTRELIQHPDTLKRAIDNVLELTDGNRDIFRHIAVFLFNHFRQSTIMGHDAVLVKIADDIYLSGRADWASEEFINNLRQDIERLRPSLIGNKAANMAMESYSHGRVELHDLEAEYIVIYFWEPECGHCKEATPLLHDYHLRSKDEGVLFFTVGTSRDRDEWEKHIKENGLTWINGWDPQRNTRYDFYYNVTATPLIYILDSEKRIVAKRLAAADVENFINNHRSVNR